ncbi:hypothetical protein [Amycolatopsis regifaucium]|uniref:hypothetical protein n=1 Tax=Amycolatopsis regifaucium TaxID=546365 RepID=UPI0008F67C37|nr:hypothetical protein [Amycolatopsis regifaucium]SFG72483.1 hypothetical protein SAMN04489731_101274 [Amycolatopsis regifaucium]
MPIWLQVLTSLIAALIGGAVSPQVTQAKDRRAARAAVREKVAEVDALGWHDEPYPDFRRAVAALEAAAILAGVPRSKVLRFTQAVIEARNSSETYDEGPDGEPLTVRGTAEEEAMRGAIEDLSRSLWHPWLEKLRPIAARLKRWRR